MKHFFQMLGQEQQQTLSSDQYLSCSNTYHIWTISGEDCQKYKQRKKNNKMQMLTISLPVTLTYSLQQ